MKGLFKKKANSENDLQKHFLSDSSQLKKYLGEDLKIIEEELKDLKDAYGAIPANLDLSKMTQQQLDVIRSRLEAIHAKLKSIDANEIKLEKTDSTINTLVTQMGDIIFEISQTKSKNS